MLWSLAGWVRLTGNDEGELHPEGDAKDRVLAIVDSKALVLPTDEDGADDVADNEHAQADVMHSVVVVVIEDRKQDKANCAHDRSDDAYQRVDLLPDRCVGCKLAGVAQITLKDEGKIEGNNSDRGHSDEHGLEVLGTNIWKRC